MSFNIVTAIINMIAPAVLDKLAASLGISSATAKAALAAAVPAVLGAMGSKASTETGARSLFDAVSKAGAGEVSDLAATLTGASGAKFLEGGLGSLGSLLGDASVRGLTGAIGKQAGLGADASASIVGLAGQLAMTQLGKSVTGEGLNASSLVGLLSSQQANIASALPAGLGSVLSNAGVLGGSFAGQASRAAGDAARAASASTVQAAEAAKKKGSKMLAWIIPLVVIAGAAWYFLGQGTQAVKEAAQQAAGSATSLVVDGVDLNSQLTSAVDGLKTTLGGITDAASAQAALPKLEEALNTVDGASALLGKLTPDQRGMVAKLVSAALPSIRELIAKVLAIPGVSDVMKPTADALLAKVEALANPA